MSNIATLRLFNAIQVKSKKASKARSVSKDTIRNGYVLHPAINPTAKTLREIESVIGISGERANASFHKSWKVIRDASMETLVLQQIIHYFTTYGFEQLGVFDSDCVYIPAEKLEIPEIQNDIQLVVVNALTPDEIHDRVISLVSSGVALSKQTLDDLMSIIGDGDYNASLIDSVKNRELRSLLYQHFDVAPTEPVEYLRYVVAQLTGESLLIKNDTLIAAIKGADSKKLDSLLKHAPENLGAIFLRFKPLFLAMKSLSRNKKFFNKLRKSAKSIHEPIPVDYLNSVTSQIAQKTLKATELKKRLRSATVFRKIRLAQALAYRATNSDSIVYRVRNGRGWATGFNWEKTREAAAALHVVLDSVADSIRDNVEGKVFYIPDGVGYALPATEKQFTGNFPSGTCVSVAEDLIVGINWFNVDGRRVDLDLSLVNTDGKIGWNGAYRSKSRDILFSGDITDASGKNGATELFYLKKMFGGTHLLMVNDYTGVDGAIPTKILVAQEHAKNFGRGYMVDPNNIIAEAGVELTQRQNVLGFLTSEDDDNRFYFAGVSVGGGASARVGSESNHALQYMITSAKSSPRLNDVLERAGAIIVTERPDGDYTDLSPKALTKTSILDLFAPASRQVAAV